MIQSLAPTLYTTEFNATLQFYCERLGFTCTAIEEEWQWACLKWGNAEIIISKPNDATPFVKPQFTGSFYLRTEALEELWQRLKNTVKISYPLEHVEYGMREFGIYDNNGYLLQFGETMITSANA